MWNAIGQMGYGPQWLAGNIAWIAPVLFILIPLIIALKGYALWHAARRSEIWWFVALLVLNTMGILELVYIFAVVKNSGNASRAQGAQMPNQTQGGQPGSNNPTGQ